MRLRDGRISSAGVKWLVVAAALVWMLATKLGRDAPDRALVATERDTASADVEVGGSERRPERADGRAAVGAEPPPDAGRVPAPSRTAAVRETQALLVLRVLDGASGDELADYRLVTGASLFQLTESLQRPEEPLPVDRTYRLPPDREHLVVLHRDGYASAQVRMPATPAGARFHQTLELSRAATLRFDVVDRHGRDVPDVRVFLCDANVDPERLIRTGGRESAGGYAYPMRRWYREGWRCGEAPPGDLYLHAGVDGAHVGSLWIPDLEPGETRSGLVLRVDVVQSAKLVVHLREPEGVPRGALVLERSGVRGNPVVPDVDRPGPGGDRSLTFREVKPGPYRLAYEPLVPGAPEGVRPERLLLDELELAAGDERTLEFDVTGRTSPTQRVRLLLGGEAVAGLYVYALRREGPYLRRRSAGSSDAEGFIELPALTAGVAALQVEVDGRPPAVFPDVSLDVAAGVTPTLDLTYSTGSLFLVDAESGAPLADTEVVVWPAGGYSIGRSFHTDATGRVELEAADGEQFVRAVSVARAPGASFRWSRGASEPRTVSLSTPER